MSVLITFGECGEMKLSSQKGKSSRQNRSSLHLFPSSSEQCPQPIKRPDQYKLFKEDIPKLSGSVLEQNVKRKDILKLWNCLTKIEGRIHKLEIIIVQDPKKALSLERLNSKVRILEFSMKILIAVVLALLAIVLK